MPQLVVTGAMLACTMSPAPGTFTATANPTVTCSDMPVGSIMDFAPMANIASFGMCMSPANPQVAAATAAALGVLTPQPCIPAVVSPWTPGSPVLTVNGQPALDSTCMNTCMWAGMISITFPGQVFCSDT